jgi:hypothetical protein
MQCILGFCDAQIVTGIAIMISAYGSLPGKDGISAYHWQIAVYLAWFANLTHLTALTFLRSHLHRHHEERNWRIAAMLVLFFLLFVGQIPTAFFNWADYGSEPSAAVPSAYARCFFSLKTVQALWDKAAQDSVLDIGDADSVINACLSILLLAFSFLSRVVMTSERLSALIRNRIRSRVSRSLREYIRRWASDAQNRAQPPWKAALLLVLRVRPGVAAVLTARLYADLLSSMFSEVSIRLALWPHPSPSGLAS